MDKDRNVSEQDNDSLAGIIEINDSEFRKISQLVYTKFGINLTDKKKALVRGRLNKLLKEMGYTSFREYYDSVVGDQSNTRLMAMVDRISTNHTYFYRESDHFVYLKDHVFPELDSSLRDPVHDLRIWSSGCASGEEAYTIAMLLMEHYGKKILTGKPVILATDISDTALANASRGVYPLEKVSLLPPHLSHKYLKKEEPGFVSVHDDLKKMILFRRLNFMNQSFPFKGKFHIVFCRNVMIYFDNETKNALIEKFHRYMHNDSLFFIGHSESLGRNSDLFTFIQPALYRRK